MLPSQQVVSDCQGKGLEIRFLCHGTEKTCITSHISLAMTSHMAACEGARECRLFVCLERGEKLGVGEHCIPLLHIGGYDIWLEWNLRVWYYGYSAGDAKFLGTQVWATAFFLATMTTCKLWDHLHIGRWHNPLPSASGCGSTSAWIDRCWAWQDCNKFLLNESPSYYTFLGFWLWLRGTICCSVLDSLLQSGSSFQCSYPPSFFAVVIMVPGPHSVRTTDSEGVVRPHQTSKCSPAMLL